MLDDKTIAYVSKLSRLELNEAEQEQVKKDLGDIIGYVDRLNELDTEGTEPLSHAFPVVNVLREDAKAESWPAEEILKNAADKTETCFKVPQTVEG